MRCSASFCIRYPGRRWQCGGRQSGAVPAGLPTSGWHHCDDSDLLTVLRHLRERLNADLERDWKQQLLDGLLHGDYASVSSYHSAELLNRLNSDVSKVNEGELSAIPNVAAMATRLIATIVVLGVMDPRFTLLVAVLGVIVMFATGMMRRQLKELNKLVRANDGRVSGFLQEIMEKLLMVQTMDVSSEEERRSEVLLGHMSFGSLKAVIQLVNQL